MAEIRRVAGLAILIRTAVNVYYVGLIALDIIEVAVPGVKVMCSGCDGGGLTVPNIHQVPSAFIKPLVTTHV